MSPIEAAVGDSSPDIPIDVIRIQDLLNNSLKFTGMKQTLDADGTVSGAVLDAIRSVQRNHPGNKSERPDGRVSPSGSSERTLVLAERDTSDRSTLPRNFDSNTLTRFDIDGFVALCARQCPQPELRAAPAIRLRDLTDRVIA